MYDEYIIAELRVKDNRVSRLLLVIRHIERDGWYDEHRLATQQ